MSDLSPFLVLGYGCYWAWTRLSWHSAVLAVHGEVPYVVSTTAIASAAANVCTVLLFILFERRLSFLRTRRGSAIAVASALMTIGTTLTLVPIAPRESGLPVLLLGSLLTGVGSGTLVLLLGALFGMFNIRNAALHTSLSWVFAVVVYEAVVQLHSLLAAAITAVLPLFLGASLLAATGGAFKSEALTGRSSRIRFLPNDAVVALVALFIYCFAYLSGSTLFKAGGADATAAFGRYSMLGGGLVALLIVLATVFELRNVPIGLAYRPVILIVIAGLLLTPALVDQRASAIMIFGAGDTYLFIVVWIVLSGLTYRLGLSPIRVFGAAQIVFLSAVISGVPFGQYLSSIVNLGRTQSLVLPVVTSLVLITTVLLALMMNEERIIGGWGLADAVEDSGDDARSEGGAWIRKCKAAAAEHGLSARETEIMIMLGKGRSLPYIQEALHIASGTAHTHARHIYAKMEIHSRQQLIDLIEGRSTVKDR